MELYLIIHIFLWSAGSLPGSSSKLQIFSNLAEVSTKFIKSFSFILFLLKEWQGCKVPAEVDENLGTKLAFSILKLDKLESILDFCKKLI